MQFLIRVSFFKNQAFVKSMFIRNKILLLGLFFTGLFSQAEDGNCRAVFDSAKGEVREALKDKPAFITDYAGQDGYLRFVESLKATRSMDYVFKLVSQILNKTEKKIIGWQKFYGTAKEYVQTLERILVDQKNVRSKYKGMKGYLLYANDFYKGDMQITYKNISTVLNKRQIRELGWQYFQGSTKDYNKTETQILNENARSKYKGMEGYALYADHFNKGDMRKTYKNVSVVLSKRQMRELDWQAFQGKTQEFRELRSQILDKKGKVKYKGMEGCVLYADSFFKGDMHRTYVNTSAVLSKKEMQTLQWQIFQGSTKDYRKTLERVLDDKGNVRVEYKGMYGYALYADNFNYGDMRKTYINISAVLSKRQMRELNWQAFQGSTKSYRKARSQILTDNGVIRSEYKNLEGYILYTDIFSDGNMKKAYRNTSAVLDKRQMRELGWQAFQGSTEDYRKAQMQILDSEGKIRSEYRGIEGYILYADRSYEGDMQKAYTNISAVLDKSQMQELGWQSFQGTTQEFRKQRDQILDQKGSLISKYKNRKGHVLYSDSFYEGDMKKAYKNTSAVLNKADMQVLKWQYFQGTTKNYRKTEAQILDDEGKVRSKYKDMEGYVLYADNFSEGSMKQTHLNVSAILDRKQMRELGWQLFRGSVQEFKEERSQILNSEGKVRPEYKGMEGYALYADSFYEGDMQKTYQQISTVLGGLYKMKEFGLSWKQFKGFVSQYYALKELFERYEIEELKGSEGQEMVIREVFNGNKYKAYHNVSILRESLLGSREAFTELGWTR